MSSVFGNAVVVNQILALYLFPQALSAQTRTYEVRVSSFESIKIARACELSDDSMARALLQGNFSFQKSYILADKCQGRKLLPRVGHQINASLRVALLWEEMFRVAQVHGLRGSDAQESLEFLFHRFRALAEYPLRFESDDIEKALLLARRHFAAMSAAEDYERWRVVAQNEAFWWGGARATFHLFLARGENIGLPINISDIVTSAYESIGLTSLDAKKYSQHWIQFHRLFRTREWTHSRHFWSGEEGEFGPLSVWAFLTLSFSALEF